MPDTIELQNVSKYFGSVIALRDISTSVNAGEVLCLLGDNGAGKSTLIKCLTGAYQRDAGTLLLDGAPINPASTAASQKLGIGTVYQEVNLLPNLTVAENLFLGRQPLRGGFVSRRRMNAMARETLAGYGLKSFLIAQTLTQIEKAYGPNNAILDNCHVRVSFATNDERTAKRISDALGTATEMRAMKNYAGHRLSPWLGHLMVSRSETARQLLTPGEIMQLPPEDEIVMVAGTPPIRAKKARYYTDPRLMERILPPPDPAKIAVMTPTPAIKYMV